MAHTLNAQRVTAMLPQRPHAAHKGHFGALGILAGSSCFRGAALLCADAALRAGVGIVRLAAIETVCAAAAVRTPAATLLPCPAAADGGLVPEAAEALIKTGPTAILAGCGLSATVSTMRLVERLLAEARCALVLDADALNVLAGHLDGETFPEAKTRLQAALAGAVRPVVLTPHVGEMARLCGLPVAVVRQGRQACAVRLARETGCVVVLKSHATVIAGPGGEVFINDKAGNTGLAKGGSGDVLAGIIAALLAQGVAAVQAAAAGVWLHASAADLAAKDSGFAGLAVAELPAYLARVQRDLGV